MYEFPKHITSWEQLVVIITCQLILYTEQLCLESYITLDWSAINLQI